jgi:pimeloyl-ACP methyl ester carboxylesterase
VINPRRYGKPPFSVAVIHGGPGAGGEMAPVAQQLCTVRGILEPLQTAHSLEAQVEELKGLLEECADLPVTLIGFSWGAWLSFILAARYPAMVRRLIMVSSGPFLEKYAPKIMQTRLSRLRESEIDETDQVRSIFAILDGSNSSKSENESKSEKNRALARLDGIFSRTDAFDPIQCQSIEPDDSIIPCRADIYQSVWKEASHLRQTGELLQLGRKILCPVTALHGDWDPHPAMGVCEPLQATIKSFEFILLKRCGHRPWTEKWAKDKFYTILRELIDF